MAKSSPFESIYQRLGANFAEFDGWVLPSDFGNPSAEAHALEHECAAFDLSSFGRLSVRASDPAKMLERAGFELEEGLTDGYWSWAVLKNGDGGVRCRVGCTDREAVVLTPSGRSCAVMGALERGMEGQNGESSLTDLTDRTGLLALYGPKAVESVAPLLPLDLDSLPRRGMMKLSFFMMNLIVFRGSWLDGDGLELICPASAAPLAGGAIAKYHEKQNIRPAGMACLKDKLRKAGLG
jgi:aminomethyltransferase